MPRRQPGAAVDDDADRARVPHARQPAGERRVVGERACGPHHHGVVARPEQMAARAGVGAGDPAAVAGARGDAAVETARELECHQGSALPNAREEARVERPRVVLHAANRHLDSRLFEQGVAATRDPRVGVFEGDDGARDAGLHQCLGARAGLAVMGAGFQGGVAGGALRAIAGAGERLGLGMGPAAGLGPATADDPSVLYEHAADRRVGPHGTEAALGERKRKRHETAVEARVRRRHALSPARRRACR